MRSSMVGFLCAAALLSCGPKEASEFDGDTGHVVVEPTGSRATGTPASGTVSWAASREALAPLHLRQPLMVNVTAGQASQLALPIPFSTQGVWARVTSPQPATLEIAGAPVPVSQGTLVYFPAENRELRFTPREARALTLELVAGVDSAGGGFEAKAETPVTLTLGTTPLRLPDAAVTASDDTFARLVEVQLRSAAATRVRLGSCGAGGDAPEVEEAWADLLPNQPTVSTHWLSPGALCLASDAAVEVTLTVQGRVRRFATTSLRALAPLPVLDTAQGLGGWSGRPLGGQSLAVSLAGLTGLTGATHGLFRVEAAADAPMSARIATGACGTTGRELVPGALALLPTDGTLCVQPNADFDVRLTLVAAVTPRSEAPGVCGARPPMPACSETTLLGRLNCIPGVSAVPYSSPRRPAGTTQYALTITQPADHSRPDGATFGQRALLTVRNETAPLVLHTTGYNLFDYFSDLSSHFATNELELEHRFFEDSTPQPFDWSTLTIMQSAADSHRVVELLSPLFTGPWINTGHSKGGMTALYHRRFYPCDVAASAPYVTPLSLGKQDARYGPWLAQLGGANYATCRQVFEDLEKGVIEGRATYAPQLQGTYTRVGSRINALYAITGNSLWGTFQSGRQDDPQRGCPAWEPLLGDPQFPAYVDQFAQYGESMADESLAQSPLDAYSYQTQNELGSPGANRAHLTQFGPIPELPDDGAMLFGSQPLPAFEARAMPDVQRWLAQYGAHFLFIYGGFDPWTAGQVDATGATDTLKYIVPGASHGVSIEDLPEPQREEAYLRVESWLGVRRLPKRAGDVRGERLLQYRDVMHLYKL